MALIEFDFERHIREMFEGVMRPRGFNRRYEHRVIDEALIAAEPLRKWITDFTLQLPGVYTPQQRQDVAQALRVTVDRLMGDVYGVALGAIYRRVSIEVQAEDLGMTIAPLKDLGS